MANSIIDNTEIAERNGTWLSIPRKKKHKIRKCRLTMWKHRTHLRPPQHPSKSQRVHTKTSWQQASLAPSTTFGCSSQLCGHWGKMPPITQPITAPLSGPPPWPYRNSFARFSFWESRSTCWSLLSGHQPKRSFASVRHRSRFGYMPHQSCC